MDPPPLPSSSSGSRRKNFGQPEPEFSPYRSTSREDMAYAARSGMANTIRTVTPEDTIPEGQPITTTNDFERFIPDRQPGSPQAGNGSSSSHSLSSRFRAGSNTERAHPASMREHPSRPRTRTLDERSPRDQSPVASGSYGRSRQHRMGSVHSVSSTGFRETTEDAVHSIGHPAIVPASLAFNLPLRGGDQSRGKLIKSQSRDNDSLPISGGEDLQQLSTTPTAANASSTSTAAMSRVPPTDTRKMLQLMKSTRGRMEGPLAFRRVETVPWSLSYCSINDESGSLVYEPKSGETFYKTLIPDLRGCNIKPAWDAESHLPYLDVWPQNSKLKVHLRPHSQDEFDSWFAALLCWQPIRPKGMQNRMTKTADAPPGSRPLMDTRRHSEVSLQHREAPVIKVGKMIFWDTNVSYSYTGTPKSKGTDDKGKPQATSRMQSFGSRRWRRVSCTLRENGELKLFSEQDQTLVSCVQLSQLCRCAVQRLDPSVLDNDYCIAIYPQYATSQIPQTNLRAIYVSLESRILYEVWLVLLRAFTIPQLYGPKQTVDEETPNRRHSISTVQPTGTKDMFRMERTLTVRIVDARVTAPSSPHAHEPQDRPRSGKNADKEPVGGYYAEVLLDGETRAKTMVKTAQQGPLWREEFEFLDLPAVLSVASVVLKKRPPSTPHNERSLQKEMRRIHDALNATDSIGGQTGISFDAHVGKVDLYLDDLEPGKSVEKWWTLTDHFGQSTGEMLINITVEESVILMARDYQPMSEILHNFSNGLTLQIAQMVPGELKRISECLLNIFQVSGKASEWISSLIEEEIDGITRSTPALRHRFARRTGSNDSGEGTQFGPQIDRELMVRDMGKSATLEANLLFRGNTLLTKSLDFHMKRLGKEWLDDTLGDKLKEIADKDPNCEVDPAKVGNLNDLDRNWRKLIGWTAECWKCIYQSATKCPSDLRSIFRHIRACAEERYGDFLKSVRYSSVSGFLFLRFFCPAILNPKLFGLLKDHPKPNARRTFTLIAKSIQTLANMATFGQKEQWMEPMNTFLTSHRSEFKAFLDNVCSISAINNASTSPIPPPYSTPLAILTRLPPTSREGFPSLPYLIDHAKNFAALVTLWLDHANQQSHIGEEDGDLLKFHNICINLRNRTEECLAKAERAERPSSTLSFRWEELVEGLETANTQRAQARSLHSRVGSSSASTTRSNPESPIEAARNRDRAFEMPMNEDVIVRAKSTTGRRHNSQSSAISSTASPQPGSDGRDDLQYDSATPPRSAHDDQPFGSHAKSSSRAIYPFSAGSLSSTDTSRTKDRNASIHLPVTRDAPLREGTRTPAHGISPSASGNLIRESHNHSSSSGEDRSWLGDVAEDSRDAEAIALSSWANDRERTWRTEGDGLVRSSTSNGRPTRNPNKRHAVVQQRAEEMEPGEPKDWTGRPLRSNGGSSVERLPRRDWAIPTDERQRRLVIDLAAQRAEAIRAGSAVQSPTSMDGMEDAFSGRGPFGRLAVQSNLTYPPGSSQSNSYPNSRRDSRQGSIVSAQEGSDGEEGTTALPRMQYKNAAAAVGAEIGVTEGYSGSTEGKKEREKSVFDRIGFSKKKR
ncbi:uncharacterized protein PV09_00849 [Verruconis gallopava]|uniref:Ras-GAP domain-containing protein n=1 Tax=Verruconis gallopava TaxID=253628 RepID=A0A0D2AQJ5_9PEZI|nr:uncharacterized protein PV09_00849 [Verruconis gallopava]KIW08933.1 hypothetical protein PV09_00849 [Verruconis gallopava]